MINENIEQSIEILEKDASFIANIKNVISRASDPTVSQDEVKADVKKAHSLLLHILDYCVTLGMIDMDADLLRLCIEKPLLAKRFSKTLNSVGVVLKQNYQYLCKEGTLYNEGLPFFKQYYALALDAAIKKSAVSTVIPDYVIDFNNMEFIRATNKDTLIKKLELLDKTEFDIEAVRKFIDNCLSWSDTIDNYLKRAGTDRTILDMDDTILRSIFDFCGRNVFSSSSTSEAFVKAIKNIQTPTFQVQIKDYFYTLVLALYDSLGPLSPRDAWRDEVLKAFGLEAANYRNAKSRIKSDKASKLTLFYKDIVEIISRGK